MAPRYFPCAQNEYPTFIHPCSHEAPDSMIKKISERNTHTQIIVCSMSVVLIAEAATLIFNMRLRIIAAIFPQQLICEWEKSLPFVTNRNLRSTKNVTNSKEERNERVYYWKIKNYLGKVCVTTSIW